MMTPAVTGPASVRAHARRRTERERKRERECAPDHEHECECEMATLGFRTFHIAGHIYF